MDTSEKITVAEASEFLECTYVRVVELLRLGYIPGLKFGKSWVIPRAEFFRSISATAAREAERRRQEADLVSKPAVPPKPLFSDSPRRGRPRFPRSEF